LLTTAQVRRAAMNLEFWCVSLPEFLAGSLPILKLHNNALGKGLSHILGSVGSGIAAEDLSGFAFRYGTVAFL
jgi:hypothetical protein